MVSASPGPAQPPRWTAGILAAAAFTAVYLAAATVGALVTGNAEFVFYIVIMLVLVAAVIAVHWRVRFSTGVIWLLSIWGLMHMAGGLVPVPDTWPIHGDTPVLYSLWLYEGRVSDIRIKYDHIVHAFGFAVTTWVCWQALRAAVPNVRPTLGPLVLCAVAGMGFGALNEVVEFIAVLTVPETNVGGYVNTGWDLVANTVGATTAAIVIGLGSRPRTPA